MSTGAHRPQQTEGSHLAQFFTPLAVADFMWQLARELGWGRDSRSPRVIDPSAGDGIFLRSGIEGGLVKPDRVFGIEIDPELQQRAPAARIFCGDGLRGEFPGVEPDSFDMVIGNPPFGRASSVLPPQELAKLEASQLPGGGFGIAQAKPVRVRNRDGRPAAGGPDLVGDHGRGRSIAQRHSGLESAAMEQLFLERALQLARPGGLVLFVMPDGFLANSRAQAARDWVMELADVIAVVALPEKVFRGPRLSATTDIIALGKKEGGRKEHTAEDPVILVGSRRPSLQRLPEHLAELLKEVKRTRAHPRRSCGVCFSLSEKRLRGNRWDVEFWRGMQKLSRSCRGFPMARLGDFIQHLTYGPIITGSRPQHLADGVRVIRQGDFTETGLNRAAALRVSPGSAHDPPRSRVARGDLLLPRSGAGAVGRNRMAVYVEAEVANVGCFVDLIRLGDLNPFFAWLFFRSRPGWDQIRSAINGVGTPNINFSEIRALRIPTPPGEVQEGIERRYRREVLPLHLSIPEEGDGARIEAERRFRKIADDLEMFLSGQRGMPEY